MFWWDVRVQANIPQEMEVLLQPQSEEKVDSPQSIYLFYTPKIIKKKLFFKFHKHYASDAKYLPKI